MDDTVMPRFLDAHHLKPFNEENLKDLQKSPVDEFGVTHVNLMFNEKEDKFYCLLDAPNMDAVDKHHKKHGVTCDWITEVKTTA